MPQTVERSHYIGFACLPEKTQQLPVGHTWYENQQKINVLNLLELTFYGTYSTVIGWGKRRHSDESGTNVLHEAEVPIISSEACKSVYYDYVITKNMFCAGANRVDTCAGDSGGPILCR